MNIVQVSNSDIGGGAEGVAWDLFESFQAMGESSWLAVGEKKSSNPHVLEIPNFDRRSWWTRFCLSADRGLKDKQNQSRSAWLIRRMLAAIGDPPRGLSHLRGHEDFRFPGTDVLLNLFPQPPQILQCHNLHGAYFDLRQLPRLSRSLPVVLTLHDAWLTTGHCAHSLECQRWVTGCGKCPDLSLYPAILRDATSYNWEIKKNIFSASRLYVATPSKWLMDKVERSILRAGIIESRVIPNGVDLNIFKPGDSQADRIKLGVPLDALILSFVAVKFRKNAWKDFSTLHSSVLKIASALEKRKIVFLAIGEHGDTERIGNAEIRYVGPVHDRKIMASYYRASDIYLHAARADTFPSSILEAQACGVPVVATAVGGISEQIVDGLTGWLTPPGDPESMAQATLKLSGNEQLRREMGLRGVERTRKLYDLKLQACAYRDWHREIHSSVNATVQAG